MTAPDIEPIQGAIPPDGATAKDEPEALLQNLMLFGEVLRRMGLNFGSANMLDLVRATEDVPVGRKQDFSPRRPLPVGPSQAGFAPIRRSIPGILAKTLC